MPRMNYTRSFAFHGVALELNSDQNLVADCPFCGKEYHLGVNQDTGQWRCLRCEAKGNLYSFLRQWWKMHYEGQDPTRLKSLSTLRKIPAEILEENCFAWDSKNDCWLIPIFKEGDPNKSILNLKQWNPEQKTLKSTPNCSQHPYYPTGHYETLLDPETKILVCEGEWDALAAASKLAPFAREKFMVVGMPGAMIFKDTWTDIFSGREVWLLYDNDDAGRSGSRNATNILSASRSPPSRIRVLAWPEGTPDGFDIRDLVDTVHSLVSEESSLPQVLDTADRSLLVDAIADNVEVNRNTWEQVLEDFRAVYHVDRTFADVCTLVAACCVAARVPGDPLWMFLVGPPSTSKTAIVDAFSFDKEHCETLSKLTATQLVSGWKVPGSDEDVSIFPRLRSRTLLIQDYTTIIAMPAAAQEDLYGMLREAYGGKVRIRYGNGKTIDQEDVYFSMVAAVTDVIRKDSKADLGERFLKVEVVGEDYDSMAVTLAAMNGVVKDAERVRKLQILGESIKSYLGSLYINPDQMPIVDDNFRFQIGSLSLVVGHLRAIVQRDEGEIEFRPRAEGGGRVAKQLLKLALCLCILQKKTRMDDEVMRLVRKAAVDTIWGFSLELCQLMAKHSEGLTTDEITHRLQLPKTIVRRITEDLQKLNVLHRGKTPNAFATGRDSNSWQFTGSFGTLWHNAGLSAADRGKVPLQSLRKKKKTSL